MADLRFYLRWVASEHNNVDGPSRDMRRPSVDAWAAAKARAKAALNEVAPKLTSLERGMWLAMKRRERPVKQDKAS